MRQKFFIFVLGLCFCLSGGLLAQASSRHRPTTYPAKQIGSEQIGSDQIGSDQNRIVENASEPNQTETASPEATSSATETPVVGKPTLTPTEIGEVTGTPTLVPTRPVSDVIHYLPIVQAVGNGTAIPSTVTATATPAAMLTASPTSSVTPSATTSNTPAPTTTATASASPTVTPPVIATLIPTATPGGVARTWPDTSNGIHVFNDQLIQGMSNAQVQFAATHYAGTQKIVRSEADRLRAENPNFIILHYRLGEGLGYRSVPSQDACLPSGDPVSIVEGNQWVTEWPGDSAVQEAWFYHAPITSTRRILNCDWGWYLLEVNDASLRSYWQGEVLRQVQANANDGLFLDSLSVPNYLGFDHFSPDLPEIDATFEAAWSTRIHDWLSWLQSQPIGAYTLIPNVGMWITTRDNTDYSPADGVMVEGFALVGASNPLAYEDWKLQMNRLLATTQRGQIVIAQSYPSNVEERSFALGSYLLVKGNRSYLNLELGLEPEWWPEYDIPIGVPLNSASNDIQTLDGDEDFVYRRNFSNGFVLVNPTSFSDGTAVTTTLVLRGSYRQAIVNGGGAVSPTGLPSGTLSYQNVTNITLGPNSAAVLLHN